MVSSIVGVRVRLIPSAAVKVGLNYYFAAKSQADGRELWKTDLTRKRAVLVKDIRTGSQGSNPEHLVNFKGTLIFVADDGRFGKAIWKSDGTRAGTVLVRNDSEWKKRKL